MSDRITGISSMATRQVLAELGRAYEQRCACTVVIEAVGGVDAAKRVQAGEPFDVVVLAADAIDRLIASGHVVAGSRIDLVRSPVAMAVRAGAAHPDVASEQAVRRAVLAARRVSYSTGPSGVYLTQLFARWGIADEIKERIVLAPPGVPVGTLVASGDADLGFQQLSELMHLDGIAVLGVLPDDIAFITVFSAGLCAVSTRAVAARGMLDFMTSPEAADAIRRHGMEPA
jgi:molybdate transport system substrate-binding protein